MPVPRELQVAAKVACGDRVLVVMEVDSKPPAVPIPAELMKVLEGDVKLALRFEELPPAHRRAWATHVAGAKQAETRIRRAAKAVAGIREKKFPGQ